MLPTCTDGYSHQTSNIQQTQNGNTFHRNLTEKQQTKPNNKFNGKRKTHKQGPKFHKVSTFVHQINLTHCLPPKHPTMKNLLPQTKKNIYRRNSYTGI